MTRNMGRLDRGARAFLVAPAAAIAALPLGVTSIAGLVLLGVAAIMLGTAVVGFCPAYTTFHIDTRGRRQVVHG